MPSSTSRRPPQSRSRARAECTDPRRASRARNSRALLSQLAATLTSRPPCARRDSSAVLFSNRSGALTAAGSYDAALADADRCIALEPAWAKGHTRKASSLHGLRRWASGHAHAIIRMQSNPLGCE